MLRWAGKWLRRSLILLVLLIAGLLAPVGYVELSCKGDAAPASYAALLSPEHHRPESRTLLTYPEWHIVHAYDDYAEVIRQGDPHQFGFLRSIGGFWSSLCALSRQAASHGGFPGETKQMVYTIGVSFTAEMLAKAAYEETLGRLAAGLRGPEPSALDVLSAKQAADYARFLQQVPWYRWDFTADAAALAAGATGVLRDRERRLALGLEYRVKAAYARLIEQAVANVGADALRLRMVVRGVDASVLSRLEGVEVIGRLGPGLEIETPRYRELTYLLAAMAGQGADFAEIAGNDQIMLTALSGHSTAPGALHSFPRQGHGDWRHLILLPLSDLGDWLRRAGPDAGLRLEHIHDY